MKTKTPALSTNRFAAAPPVTDPADPAPRPVLVSGQVMEDACGPIFRLRSKDRELQVQIQSGATMHVAQGTHAVAQGRFEGDTFLASSVVTICVNTVHHVPTPRA